MSESDPKKIWAVGAVTLRLFFWDYQMNSHCHQQKYLKPTFVLCMVWIHVQRADLSSRAEVALECIFVVDVFLLLMPVILLKNS